MNSSNDKNNENQHSASKSRTGKEFIPISTSPDNWPFWGVRSNPLSSKGGNMSLSDYEEYTKQTKDEDMEDYEAHH